jgi:uncharacterized membrane protein (DUF485 family)
MTYAISTIALVIYFALVALAAFGVWVASNTIMGIVALVIAIALLARK